jgi:1-acyl-sn-glycerol-3-phosphate acyltransferase
LWLAVAAVIDAFATRSLACRRAIAFLAVFLLCEVAGMLASAVIWVRHVLPGAGDHAVYLRRNFTLQRWWARTLFRWVRRIFSMRIVVDGDETVAPGPIFVLLRHASAGDTLIPAVLVADRHDVMLRFVMKRELLWDPCLDIVGNRLPNYFVRRGGDSDQEIAAIRTLARDLGAHDGVLIYPEGTRFTPAKRERAVARLRESGSPRLSLAERLRHVLPPRLGGVLGLLDADPSVDVVFCAHVGFEGTATAGAVLRGALVNRVIRVKLWRVASADIPRDNEGRARWLYEQWQRLDDWIHEAKGAPATHGHD